MDTNEWARRASEPGGGHYAIAVALAFVGRAIDRLGNADAATPMGGLEALGAVFKEGLESLSQAVTTVADQLEAIDINLDLMRKGDEE